MKTIFFFSLFSLPLFKLLIGQYWLFSCLAYFQSWRKTIPIPFLFVNFLCNFSYFLIFPAWRHFVSPIFIKYHLIKSGSTLFNLVGRVIVFDIWTWGLFMLFFVFFFFSLSLLIFLNRWIFLYLLSLTKRNQILINRRYYICCFLDLLSSLLFLLLYLLRLLCLRRSSDLSSSAESLLFSELLSLFLTFFGLKPGWIFLQS